MKHPRFSIAFGLGVATAIAACNSLLGLDDLEVETQSDGGAGRGGGSNLDGSQTCGADCTNQRCTQRATESANRPDGGVVPAVCVKQTCECVELFTAECQTVTGDYTDDDAILIGSLFQTSGAQANTNLARQRAAILAVNEVNRASGGIPRGTTSADARPLVMLSCNAFVAANADAGVTAENTGLLPAARHLVNDLRVPAIVGPNTSQDTLDVSQRVTIPGGTLVLSPTALAESISALNDDDLTWLMVPTDAQRAPLMIKEPEPSAVAVGQIKAIEAKLNEERAPTPPPVKLAIVYRNDALGIGTNDSLTALRLNGMSLAQQQNTNVVVKPYSPANTAAQWTTYVDDLAAFAPDIVVLAGTAEAVIRVMVPLETALQTAAALTRPYYVLIDSSRVPELREAVKADPMPSTLRVPDPDGLRKRVRGTGITPGAAQPVFDKFSLAYGTEYPANAGEALNTGVASSYDATYAIAYALTATRDMALTGKNVAVGLRQLAGGTNSFNVGAADVLKAFRPLQDGEKVSINGTYGPFTWNERGAVLGGTLEVWCIDDDAPRSFVSAGLTYNLLTQSPSGAIDPAKCAW
jgi:branched-chain amino acid transport system substrate-binding protein